MGKTNKLLYFLWHPSDLASLISNQQLKLLDHKLNQNTYLTNLIFLYIHTLYQEFDIPLLYIILKFKKYTSILGNLGWQFIFVLAIFFIKVSHYVNIHSSQKGFINKSSTTFKKMYFPGTKFKRNVFDLFCCEHVWNF